MNRYNAFISYSHTDCGSIASVIQNGLQTIGRPWYQLRRNLNIFRDETNLSVTPELWPAITSALDSSDYFILFASPVAATSRWVKDEIDYWINKKNNYDTDHGIKNMFIVLAKGEIQWSEEDGDFDWSKTDCLPESMVSRKFTSNPYWIDLKPYVRENKNGREIDYKAAGFTTAMTKIIGGITGVPPWQIESDELKSQRNSKRVRGITAAVFIVLSIIISALYIDANKQRKEAEAQRNDANTQRRNAEIQKDSAVNNLKQFKIEEFNRNLRDGRIYMEAEEYSFAKAVLNNALTTATNPAYDTLPEITKQLSLLHDFLRTCEEKAITK